jgi:TetR/AcrR family transcriptional regulator, tetracycline repressor protein
MARPREPLIERDRAVQVALEMIDDQGLAAFSVEKLSRRLGVRGPSLYHHFTDRADLLARVAELILHEVPDVWGPGGEYASLDWDERLLAATIELRHAVLRHANAGPVLLEYFPRRLVLRTYDRALTVLEAAGVPVGYHVLIFEGLEKLALGFGLYRAAAESSPGAAFPDFSSDEFPALNRALEASEHEEEAIFEAACRAFLVGIKTEMQASARPR